MTKNQLINLLIKIIDTYDDNDYDSDEIYNNEVPIGIFAVIYSLGIFVHSGPKIKSISKSSLQSNNKLSGIFRYSVTGIKSPIDISSVNFASLTPQRQSDWIRLYVLHKYGGIWIDSSTILTDSFKWLHNKNSTAFGYYIKKFTTNQNYRNMILLITLVFC